MRYLSALLSVSVLGLWFFYHENSMLKKHNNGGGYGFE